MLADLQNKNKPQGQSLLSQVLKDNASFFPPLKAGDVVKGIIVAKGSNLILIDLGQNGTGAVYGNEMASAREMVRELEEGGQVLGKVIDIDNEDGYVEVSISEAGKQKSWDEVIELKEKDETITVKPSGFNKGGLIVDLHGLKAFLPLSQLSSENYPKVDDGDKTKIIQELQKLLKKEFEVKVIDVNSKSNKLIISEKEALQESAKELAKGYEVGQVVDGIISGVASFGAFIKFTDNPEVEGLIHISELDYCLVENPKEVVSVDMPVKAKIIDIKEGRIYLSLKALKADPWEAVYDIYKTGQEVKGRVYSFNQFGAIISLGDVQGQIHITEFGGEDEMKAQLELGKEYDFVVGEVKPENKRIYLKLKKEAGSE